MTQEVFIRTKLNETGDPIVELRYQDKTKIFLSNYSINRFVGIYNGLQYKPVMPENYIATGMHETWDDGIEMNAEEWCKCVRAIYSVF